MSSVSVKIVLKCCAKMSALSFGVDISVLLCVIGDVTCSVGLSMVLMVLQNCEFRGPCWIILTLLFCMFNLT